MINLDWSKIKNWQDFQRLINHLFALECNRPGFIPSSPYIGADGDWDGSYEGFYPYENQTGLWSIQSKHTLKNFKEAVKYLSSEIKGALESAKRNNVDHLRIATNAQLKRDQVKELEKLNNGEVKTLNVWYRENLTVRIEKQPFLRHYFFGDPQNAAFVPWDIYFKCEKFLVKIYSDKIIKFHKEIENVKNFVLQDKSNILVIHAPGGYGKSHLLKEIAKNIHLVDRERQCWLGRLGFRDIKAALQDEIINITDRKYLLVIDDGDRYLKDVKSLISFARNQGDTVKIILATRTSGIDLIRQIIREFKCEEMVEEMCISKWSKEELTQLLQIAAEKEKVDDEDIIVNQYPNPFILVWIGKHIKGEKTFSIDQLKKKMTSSIEIDTEKTLADFSFSRRTIREFLLNLASVVPISRDDKFVDVMNNHLSIGEPEIKESINKLIEVGVLREVGKSIRFDPDMTGDLYLAFRLESLSESEINDLLERWIELYSKKLFINLASTPKYGDLRNVQAILRKLVRSWINESDKTSNEIRKHRLSLVSKITHFVPEETLDLIYSYLETKAPPTNDPIIKYLNVDIELDLDDFGPVIENLMSISGFSRKIALLLLNIDKKSLEGRYDNYKPKSLMKELVSPIHWNPKYIKEVLFELSNWLNNPDIGHVEGELIGEAVSEVLAGSYEFTRSFSGTTELSERWLRDIPVIHELRDYAFDLLKQMIIHSRLEIKISGVKSAKKIGSTWMRKVAEEELPLAKRIAKDRSEIVKVLENQIEAEAQFALLNEIENLLITWWAQDIPGTEKAAGLLRKFPHSPEYFIYRYFVSPDYVIEDFAEVENRAPEKNKWKWLVDNFFHKGLNLTQKKIHPLVEELNKRYRTPTEVTNFLTFLEREIAYYNPWARPPLTFTWVQINPSVFLRIRNQKELWKQIPDRFKPQIELSITRIDNIHVNKVAKEVLSELPEINLNKINTLLQLIMEMNQAGSCVSLWKFKTLSLFPWMWIFMPKSRFLSWILRIVKKGNSDARNLVVSKLYYLFEKSKDAKPLILLANLILNFEKTLTPTVIDNLAFTLHEVKKWIKKENKITKTFRKLLISLIKDVPKINYDLNELIEFSCTNIDCIIGLIDYRLKKSLQSGDTINREGGFQAIPFDGIGCIKDKIINYDDFEKFMAKIIQWYKQYTWFKAFDLDHLMKPVKMLKDTITKKLYLELYITDQIDNENIQSALIACKCMEFNDNTCLIFFKILEKAFNSNLAEDAKRCFLSVVHSGTYSAELGEPPPALVSKKETLQKMYSESSPGPLRTFIKDTIDAIEKHIRNNLLEDEEHLNPKI